MRHRVGLSMGNYYSGQLRSTVNCFKPLVAVSLRSQAKCCAEPSELVRVSGIVEECLEVRWQAVSRNQFLI